jgi:hypothetical protein
MSGQTKESKPGKPGTYYGELSRGGAWRWEGTGRPEDDWLSVPESKVVEPRAAPAPGTAIPGTTTLDTLCTTLFATRSGDLGSASYVWGVTGTSIVGTFPAGTTPSAQQCQIIVAINARQVWPSIIGQ